MRTLLAFLCLCSLAAAWAADKRAATVARFAIPPTIDGTLAPGEWDRAVGTAGFQNITDFQGLLLDARLGRAWCGYTNARLYLAIESELPPTGVMARQANRDADLIWDDGLEIWLDPNRDRRETKVGDQAFYQMICNPLGAIEDKRFDPAKGAPDNGWNGNWAFANGVDPVNHRWVAELSIPFADLGWTGAPLGRSIGVLLSRNYKAPWNQVTWFQHRGAFVSWFEYPRLYLTADAPAVQITSLGEKVFTGQLQLRARIVNPGPARRAAVKLLITSSDMPELKADTLLDLPAQGAVDYAYDVPEGRLHEIAQHDLSFSVASPDGAQQYLTWALKWTNAFDAMKRVGSGKKWDVRTGPDPEAAVQIAHYPTYKFLRVKVNTGELDKEAEASKSAAVTVVDPVGKTVLTGEMRWEKSGGVQEFPLSDLPDGQSTVTVTLAGYKTPFVRKITRQHFPWEGNTLGIIERVLPPFTPIVVKKNALDVVLRRYTVDGLGLWRSITSQGHELLAAPMALRADGKAVQGRGKFTVTQAHQAVYEGKAALPAATLTTRCTTEYDGCMKVELTLAPGKAKVPLQSLTLEIPLVDREMPLWHCSTSSLRVNPAGTTPAGEGTIWDSRQFPDGEWYGNFKPYLWLGGAERGLCWFADNDRGWVLNVDEKAPKNSTPCLALQRTNGVLTLRVHLVQRPTVLDRPRTLVFGLMASPGKPMPADWRQTTFDTSYADYPNIRWMGSQYWGSDSDFGAKYPRNGDLSILETVKRIRLGERVDTEAFLKAYEARNFGPGLPMGEKKKEQIMGLLRVTLGFAEGSRGVRQRTNAYWEEFHTTAAIHAEVPTFANEWSGTYGYGSTGGLAPSYRDFAVWWGAQFIRRGIGLYFDNAFPKRAYDPVTTSAYRLPNGQIQPSAGMWAHREYLKRIWVIHRTEADPRLPVLQMIHMTNTHIIPYMVWNDANLDLEWFYGPEPQQSKYAHELLRAESLGRQSGNLPLVLAFIDNTKSAEEKRIAERTKFGAMTVHEIKSRMWGEDGKLLKLTYDFGYGKDDCRVFNYWDAGYPVQTSNDAQVKSLLLQRNGQLLLILCTWNGKPERVTITLDQQALGLALTSAGNAEKTDETYVLDAATGSVTLDLEGYGVRLVRVR
jgi:hypothetical protein